MQRVLDFKTHIYEEDFLGRKFYRQTGNKMAPGKIRITELCTVDNDIALCLYTIIKNILLQMMI